MTKKTIFDKSVAGRTGCLPQAPSKSAKDMLPAGLLRKDRPDLPEVGELEVVRHFTRLSHLNYSVDGNFYPLGSCTMKYNPKFTEQIAAMPGFTRSHPWLGRMDCTQDLVQGSLEVIYESERLLCELTGMKAFTMQPMAGAHGEFTGVMLIAAYHRAKGNKKTKMLVPDSSHGTNPASAALAGYDVVNVPSVNGIVDPDELAKFLTDDVAGLMMTCPNTLGLFENNLPCIVEMLRAKDALLYYDGANMNAIMGHMRVGDVGFDVVHLNLHKTLSTPHGGGGPGSGAVGVSERLLPYLPNPRVEKTADGKYRMSNSLKQSMGPVAPFNGNFSVYLRALAYMMRLGAKGLTRASAYAVLNANYLRKLIDAELEVPYGRICMHEFVASAEKQSKEHHVTALDIAKALLDKGYHAPTIYFPLIVKECLMFEPTETESKDTLDQFAADLLDILATAKTDPAKVQAAPVTLPVRRLDETGAARNMILVQKN